MDGQRALGDLAGWEAFLHGVFAIAITLLVLDIRVPALDANATGADLVHSLVEGWPRYLAYLLGFMYIGTYWIATHRTMRLLRGVDHWSLILGLFYLMIISTVPFVTALLAEYLRHAEARLAVRVYAGTFVAIALVFMGLWRHASAGGQLLARGVDKAEVEQITRQYRYGPPAYLAAFVASFFSVWLSLAICLCLAVFFAFKDFPSSGPEAPESPT